MTIDFKDKVAIVTGAGGGLGRSHALELSKRGAKVVVNDLGGSVDGSGGSSEAAEKVVKEIISSGGQAISNGSSVTDDKGVKLMIDQTINEYGKIDILINNAGILIDKSFSKMEINDFEKVLNVHLLGSVKPTKAVWEIMKEQNYGRIIVTSSSSGLYGNFGQTNYGAAKLGLVGFMNTLKLEGQKYNVHVNALTPVAYTRMTANLMPPEAENLLTPESVTPAAIYLVSDEAPNGIILCAGAIGTPHLLQVSGVGEAEYLKSIGIEPLFEIKNVGEDLQDHYAVRVANKISTPISLNEKASGFNLVSEIIKWFISKKGLISYSPAHVGAFLKSSPRIDFPDLQFVFTPASYTEGMIGKLQNFPGITCGVWQSRPLSKGYVRASSNKISDPPLIQPNYLKEKIDQDVLIEGVKICRSLLDTSTMKKISVCETLPGDNIKSDEEILDFIRNKGATV